MNMSRAPQEKKQVLKQPLQIRNAQRQQDSDKHSNTLDSDTSIYAVFPGALFHSPSYGSHACDL